MGISPTSGVVLTSPHSPQKFFEDHVLTHKPARLWLQASLSVASKLRAKCKNLLGVPKIWLLTGIYLMEDAVTYSVSLKSSSQSASISIPVPEPTGVAALLGLAVGTRLDLGHNLEGHALAQISGRKVWAAQWLCVSARYLPAQEAPWEAPALGKILNLLDVWSLTSERSDDIEQVEVDMSNITGDGDQTEDYDDATWNLFESKVQELLEEAEEVPAASHEPVS